MSKILITGAAGFIGSHLAERLLSEGHEVTGLDNFDAFYSREIKESNLEKSISFQNFKFLERDITDRGMYKELDTDFNIVIHLAAKAGVRPSIESPDEYLRTNIEGTQNIMNWMVSANIRHLLFAGSSSVYGNNKKVPFAEDDVVDFPISPYAYTKKACELMIHSYHHLYDITALCLRFFTVYGPRQRPDLAINKFTRLIYSGETIPMYGDGSTSRDYTYIDDIISGIQNAIHYVRSLSDVEYNIINLGSNSPVRLSTLINQLIDITGLDTQIEEFEMQPGDVNTTFANIDKAQKLLSYSPSTSLREGLEKFIDWYKAQYL